MSNITPFRRVDGGAIFTCTSCLSTVFCPAPDEFAVCALCRWLDERPQIPADVRDRIRNGAVTRDRNGENGCGNA